MHWVSCAKAHLTIHYLYKKRLAFTKPESESLSKKKESGMDYAYDMQFESFDLKQKEMNAIEWDEYLIACGIYDDLGVYDYE